MLLGRRLQPSGGPRPNRVAFRLINLLFAAVFLASAALQYNDSGGVAWAALYFVGVCLNPHTILSIIEHVGLLFRVIHWRRYRARCFTAAFAFLPYGFLGASRVAVEAARSSDSLL